MLVHIFHPLRQCIFSIFYYCYLRQNLFNTFCLYEKLFLLRKFFFLSLLSPGRVIICCETFLALLLGSRRPGCPASTSRHWWYHWWYLYHRLRNTVTRLYLAFKNKFKVVSGPRVVPLSSCQASERALSWEHNTW